MMSVPGPLPKSIPIPVLSARLKSATICSANGAYTGARAPRLAFIIPRASCWDPALREPSVYFLSEDTGKGLRLKPHDPQKSSVKTTKQNRCDDFTITWILTRESYGRLHNPGYRTCPPTMSPHRPPLGRGDELLTKAQDLPVFEHHYYATIAINAKPPQNRRRGHRLRPKSRAIFRIQRHDF
jgi:hypothetical protein